MLDLFDPATLGEREISLQAKAQPRDSRGRFIVAAAATPDDTERDQ
jgi:hypothetical protein